MAKIKSVSDELAFLLEVCFQSENQRVNDFNAERLQKLSRWHGIRPRLLGFLHVNKLEYTFWPGLLIECQEIAISNMMSVKELIQISSLLAAEGITCFAYKGSVWSDWLYGDAGQRQFGDIDLLIEPKVFSQAIEILNNAGYQPDPYRYYLLEQPDRKEGFFRTDYHIPLERQSVAMSSIVEAHWQIAYPRLHFNFPSNEWESFRLDRKLNNYNLASFQNEYQFLLLLVHHGGKEQWSKLKYIADLAAYMIRYGQQTNWEMVVRLAREKGIYKLYIISLGLLKELGIPWRNEWPKVSYLTDPLPFIKTWELMPLQATNSSWPYFVHGISIHDGFKHKFKVLTGHIKYLTEWRLLVNKAKWYYENRS